MTTFAFVYNLSYNTFLIIPFGPDDEITSFQPNKPKRKRIREETTTECKKMYIIDKNVVSSFTERV